MLVLVIALTVDWILIHDLYAWVHYRDTWVKQVAKIVILRSP